MSSVYLTSDHKSDDDIVENWVQCEDPDCLKWRKITKAQLNSLNSDPWYCYMNENEKYNRCSVGEEYYHSRAKFSRKGFKYCYSQLSEGLLVWAKLIGYCKWPAVICKEPESPLYVTLDIDKNPQYYHVEFLGGKHSIAWIPSSQVDAYGNLGKNDVLACCSQPLSQMSMNRFKTGSSRKVSRYIKSYFQKKKAFQVKKKKSLILLEELQLAIDEADNMLELSPEERLQHCLFRFETGKKVLELKNTSKKIKENKPNKNRTASLKHNKLTKKRENKLANYKRKEDRLLADIELLQKSRIAFYDSYLKFIKKTQSQLIEPEWLHTPVSNFEIYSTVQEFGGFEQTCKKRLWASAARELLGNVKKAVIYGAKIKKYYSKHLLSYEKKCSSQQANHKDFSTGDVNEDIINEDSVMQELEDIDNILDGFASSEDNINKEEAACGLDYLNDIDGMVDEMASEPIYSQNDDQQQSLIELSQPDSNEKEENLLDEIHNVDSQLDIFN